MDSLLVHKGGKVLSIGRILGHSRVPTSEVLIFTLLINRIAMGWV